MGSGAGKIHHKINLGCVEQHSYKGGFQVKILAGKIVGAHGIRGGIKILSYLEKPQNFGVYKNFYIDSKRILLELNFVKNNIAVVNIEGVKKREQAEELVGKEVFIDKSELPKLAEGEFYYSDLIGLKVIEKGTFKEVGKIIAVENFGAGEVIEISFADKTKEKKLFAFNQKTFPKIDLQDGFAEIIFPEEEFVNTI